MQTHQSFEIAEAKVGLLGEGVVACGSEVLCTELDFSHVLLPIKIFADVHNRVQVFTLAINVDCFFVLVRLYVKICCLFPVITVSFKLCLFYQNDRVKESLLVATLLSVFLNEVVRLLELFKLG
jgi:hypothetical protein